MKPDPAHLEEGQEQPAPAACHALVRRRRRSRRRSLAAPLLLDIQLPLAPMLAIVALQAAFNLHAHGRCGAAAL